MVIDKRFSRETMLLLQGLIGKRFENYECDPFRFSSMVYKIVGFQIDGLSYLLKNEIAAQHYFGAPEDICNFDFAAVEKEEIHSALDGVTQIVMPVDAIIAQIAILNESRFMYETDHLLDEYHFVRGVVITVSDGREYSFEKCDDFSEEIMIRRGSSLAEQFSPVEQGTDPETGMVFKVERELVSL